MATLDDYKTQALELAINDFSLFCTFGGVNKKQLAVCIERSKGLSLRQIALKLNIPKSTVENNYHKCRRTQ